MSRYRPIRIVGALGQCLLEVGLADGDARAERDDDIAVLDLLLEGLAGSHRAFPYLMLPGRVP
jgi:hypothetical protein